MGYGKIVKLKVYGNNGIAVYSVGEREYFSKRLISEIIDIGFESQNGNVFNGYDVLDENRNCIARFENGIYATYFAEPPKEGAE